MSVSDSWSGHRLPPAPPRGGGKPWYRPRNIILFLIPALLIWAGVFLYQVMYAKPVRSVDYGAKVIDMVRREQRMPEDAGGAGGAENGWVLLRDLVNKVTPLHAKVIEGIEWAGQRAYVDTTLFYDPSGKLPEGATRAEAEALAKKYLEALREAGAFTDLQKLTTLPFAAREPQTTNLINWLLPELGGCRNLARASTARMVLAFRAGDEAERRAAFDQLLALAQIPAKQHTLIDYLVGVAITALSLGELRHELIERPPTEEQARHFLAAIERRLPLPPVRTALEGERMMAYDSMQMVFSDTGNGNGRLLITELSKFGGGGGSSADPFDQIKKYKIANLAGIVLPGRKETTDKLDEFYEAYFRQLNMPRVDRRTDPFDFPTYEASIENNLFLGIMLPALSKAPQSSDHIALDLAGTRLMLAIEIHRARTGAYPAALSDLVPGVLQELPTDPFTSKPFGYKLLKPGEDPDGRGYLLYSFARDGADNGGLGFANPHEALSTNKATGYDYIINRPRAKPAPADPEPQEK